MAQKIRYVLIEANGRIEVAFSKELIDPDTKETVSIDGGIIVFENQALAEKIIAEISENIPQGG